ncbi:MAG TPA: SulP family inorganic anion transporter, partial [Candidatus Saccharimonadales bacterium]
VPILAVIVHEHGLANLPYVTILAALFLVAFALIGIGKYIRKVPESIVLGFTAGVAVVIFCSQLNSFLGLSGITGHEHFAGKFAETVTHLFTANLPTIIVGAMSLAIILTAHRIRAIGKIPATLLAVVFCSLLVYFVPGFNSVTTLGGAYGSLPLGFPDFVGGKLDFSMLLERELWLPALKVAGLIAIESLLCAVVADRLTSTRHRSNQELFAQGAANLGSAFFGGIPATGVIARTGTIIKTGAATRVASMIHALVVVIFVVALAPLAAKIPLPVLSAVLLVTAVKISEYKEVRRFIAEKSWRLGAVLGVTMLLTIFTDLVMGVGAGLILHLAFAAHDKLKTYRDKDGPIRLSEDEVL